MTEIELCADGIFVRKWDHRKQIETRKRAKKSNVCSYLQDPCKIAEGTTLGEIFEIVDKYKLLKLVIAQYSKCAYIDEFHEQAKELPPEDAKQTPISHLEISWASEIYTLKENGETESHFEIYTDFHGFGLFEDGKIGTYSVSYSPMYELANLPVTLNNKFTIHQIPEKILPQVEYTRNFTLLDVLDAIYDDISFMGGPQDNKRFLEELNETEESISSGEVAMIPMDQITKRLNIDIQQTDDSPKIYFHPKVAEFFGVDPNDIPLDDKEIFRPDDNDNH